MNIGIIALDQRMVISEKTLNFTIFQTIIVKTTCLRMPVTGKLIRPDDSTGKNFIGNPMRLTIFSPT